MPRAGLILILILIAMACAVACGGAPEPAPRTAPDARETVEPESAGAEVGDAWELACPGPPRERLERLRRVALREARHAGETARVSALETWCPRGCIGGPRPIADPMVREVATGVLRRSIEICGDAEAIALTTELVRFQTIAAIAPAGQNPEHLRMAAFLEAWARDAGLGWRVSGDHDAWEIVLPGRASERALSLVVHADVVPVNDPPIVIAEDAIPAGWTVPAFAASVRDGRLYGRGTEDDKGPMAAAMIVLASLADAGIAPADGAIVLAAGTAEEDEWDGMQRYAAEAPRAQHVVSIDSSFPVVAAESGFVAWGLVVPRGRERARERRAVALAARGGLFLTQVPDQAELVVRAPRGVAVDAFVGSAREAAREDLESRADAAFRIDVEAVEHDGERVVRIVARGRSAHSSTAEQGRNAIWLLGGIAGRLELAENGVATTLAIVRALLDGDHHGERLGVRYVDELMGELLVAPTVLRTEDDGVRLQINMRRPRGMTSDEFRARLDAALARVRRTHGRGIRAVDDVYVGEPHVAELEGELVPTLMAIWRARTGDRGAAPISIRGGTYARLFPGAVDFGPALPGRPYTGHGADEYMELEALHATTTMLLEAALRLTGEND
ncbi:MAG: Sapep family Mn(2+)-dependent dipeptidase [Myxococcota bacterium]|nr:Sapep family Mn(2+)-dependent dipeptidase [Myxococcota bacterium]